MGRAGKEVSRPATRRLGECVCVTRRENRGVCMADGVADSAAGSGVGWRAGSAIAGPPPGGLRIPENSRFHKTKNKLSEGNV